ncbi:MAG: 2Fe-2S iron-sulfur cluster-binding protein [Candidatus Sumerlaeia bacterium]|nr:2Fe-2S iron-sulfur cluster-binding protein [Candidatus Sumerlaeia bacterium]
MTRPLPAQPAAGTGATSGYPQRAAGIANALDGVPESEILTVTLNGKTVKARKGETIMEVCHRENVFVPHYCWHPALSIAGNCRLCLVDVEKAPKPQIACQTQVAPNMVINTENAKAKENQQWMMEFLLVNHPLDCPICDRGGECQLQRYSMEYGTTHTRMADQKRKFIKPQADPLIDIERNRCIMCTRCVRFTDEIGGEHVMGVFDRGNGNYIGTFGQGPVSNIFSGNVIDLCPVGCLTNKKYRFKARPWELKQTQSTCDHCASGCKVTSWTRNEKLYRCTPPSRKNHDSFTINEDTEEFICNQGRFASDYGFSAARLDEAKIIIADRLTPTSFQNALDRAAKDLQAVVAAHGPSSVAITVSPRTTNEEALAIRALANSVLKTPNLEWRYGFASDAAADAVSLALKHATGSFEQFPDVIVVVNGQLEQQVPVTAMLIQEHARRHGSKLVLLGHHHSAYLAAHATKQFYNQPGRTSVVVEALAKAVAGDEASKGELSTILNQTDAEVSALIALLQSAERGLVVEGLMDFEGAMIAAEVPATINFTKALGAEKWGYLPCVTQRNAVGLCRLGVESKGLKPSELLPAIKSGKIKALVAFGADSLTAFGDYASVAPVLDQLPVFVIADYFDTPLTRVATTVFPLTTNLERTGTFADIEGNLALLNQSVEPQGDSRSALEIAAGLGKSLGSDAVPATLESAWAAFRKEVAPASTLPIRGLELEGSTNSADFVVVDNKSQARNRSTSYNPGSYRKDGLNLRGTLPSEALAVPHASVELETGEKGFVLLWGPSVLSKGHVENQSPIAETLLPKPFLEIQPQDALEMGLEKDQFVILHIGDRRAKAAIKYSRGTAPGCVYLTSGGYGAFDAASLGGPAVVTLEPLNEKAPNQGETLVPQEQH